MIRRLRWHKGSLPFQQHGIAPSELLWATLDVSPSRGLSTFPSRQPSKKRPLVPSRKKAPVEEEEEEEEEVLPARGKEKVKEVRWVVDERIRGRMKNEIIPSSRDRIELPKTVPPKALEVFKPLLPAGVTESGLLPPNLLPKDKLPIAYTNPSLPGRPENINNLLGLLQSGSPEMRYLASDQLRWVKTKLSPSEAHLVLEGTMEAFGWRAGLTYLQRMGSKPLYQLELRHFNQVLEACCKSEEERDKNKLAAGLRVLEEMKAQGVVPSQETLYLYLEACGRRGDYRVAQRVLQFARAHHIELDDRCLNHLVDAFSNGGNVIHASHTIKEALTHGKRIKTQTLQNLVHAHVKAGKAPHFLSSVKQDNAGTKKDLYKIAAMGFIEKGDLSQASALMDEMAATPGCEPEQALFVQLMDAYGKKAQIPEAIKVFRDMKTMATAHSYATRTLYTRLMIHCIVHRHAQTALDLWEEAERSRVPHDSYGHMAHLRAVGKVKGIPAAIKCFREIPSRNIYHYNFILSLLARERMRDEMFAWFRLMQQEGVLVDGTSYKILLGGSWVSNASSWVVGFYLVGEMVHKGITEPKAIEEVMRMCGAAGAWDSALSLLNCFPEPSGSQFGVALIALKEAGKWQEARDLLARMKERGVPPRTIDYGLAISACARAKDPTEAAPYALQLLQEIPPPGPNVIMYGAAIDACGHAGYWEKALELLEAMKSGGKKLAPSRIAYNSAISACARSGRWEEAGRLLEEMEKGGPTTDIYPDDVSFGAVIHACAVAGKVDEALRWLRHLPSCGLQPNRFHYTAAVHACKNDRRWEEAWGLLMEAREQTEWEPPVEMYETVRLVCVDAGRAEEVEQLDRWIEGMKETASSSTDSPPPPAEELREEHVG